MSVNVSTLQSYFMDLCAFNVSEHRSLMHIYVKVTLIHFLMKIPPAWVNIFGGLHGKKENICKAKHHYYTNAQF